MNFLDAIKGFLMIVGGIVVVLMIIGLVLAA